MRPLTRFDKDPPAAAPGSGRRVRPALVLAAALGLGWALPLAGQSTVPHASYRTFETAHFQVVYTEGLREVAERAAAYAEEGHRVLREDFLPPPDDPIHLIVTDHADLSNGFASVSHRPRMVLWVRPPVEGSTLSHFDDWVRLVTLHELAHVFHLDRAGSLGRALRSVLGRVPAQWPFFPGHLLPLWAIEGTAVHVESAHTAGGRLHGTLHRSLVRAHAGEGKLETLGQAMGDSPVWPGGDRPYVYGSLFFEWLEETYGPGTTADFLKAANDQWVPYRLNAAARRATGRSLESLWEEWVEDVMAEEEGSTGARQPDVEWLTRRARLARHPVPAAGGRVIYFRSDGRSDPRFVVRDSLGSERTLARWNAEAAPAWAPDSSLVASEIEFLDRWRLSRDLFRIDGQGSRRRLTHGARISHADPHPVTGALAAVEEGEGTNRLVLLRPDGTPTEVLREAEAGTHWAFPRWAPDGSRLAAVRWRRGGRMGVVLLSPGEAGEVVLAEDRSLHTAPRWSPDGRWVLWASDREGTLDIHARRVDGGRPVGPLRRVTRSRAGADTPAVDPTQRWIYHSRLTASGWELARLPYRPDRWPEAEEPLDRFVADGGGGVEGDGPGATPEAPVVGEDRPWSPLPFLAPTYWLPSFLESEGVGAHQVLPWAAGIETGGEDPVGRHRWSLEAWVPPSDPGVRPELRFSWRWAGWPGPVLRWTAGQSYRPLGRLTPEEAPADTLFPVSRERRVGLDAEFLRRRIRSAAVVTVGVAEVREKRHLREADGSRSTRFGFVQPERTFTEVRVAAGASTVRPHAFSISPEEGLGVSGTVRRRWHRSLADSLAGRPGADGSFTEGVAAGRAFLPLDAMSRSGASARTTFGVRAAVGMAEGPGARERHFGVGGGGGGGDRPLGLTWSDENPTFSVRGFPRGVIGGDRAWGASAELRIPLAVLHRGWGAWPLHLDRLAGGLFVDAAGARTVVDGARAWQRRSSVGAEAVLFHTLFFGSRSRVRGGVAVPLEHGDGASVYVQVGWSF